MSNVKKGQVTASGEWAKHLRPYGKREFWKTERKTANDLARNETSDKYITQKK
jgi:hypothetical protein